MGEMLPDTVDEGFRFGEFHVAPKSGTATGPDGEQRLEPRVMAVLVELARRANEVAKRSELFAAVWPNQVVLDENLTRAISELRKVFGPGAIKTVPKIGYRLVGRVSLASPKSRDAKTAIAVLPFLDLSPGHDHEFFADGLSEELLNLLVKISNLRVAARTSSFAFKNEKVDIATVADKLSVNYVLEGSVRVAGNKMRITAQLIDAEDGYHLWSRTYNRTLDDIFVIQDEIAASVVDALKLTLLGDSAPRTIKTDPEAYALYLQGNYFQNRKDRESLEKAVSVFSQALERDPAYARAWDGLAATYISQTNLGVHGREVGIAMAREARNSALALDDTLADAHAGMAHIQMFYDRDWVGAHDSIEKALQLVPGNAKAMLRAGSLAAILGRFDEGIVLARQAVTLDPLRIASYNNLGLVLTAANRLDEAIAAFRQMLDLNPRAPTAHFLIAQALLLAGNPQAALAEVEQEPDAGWRAHGMALTLHSLGQKDEGERALADFIDSFHRDMACQIANTHAWRNEVTQAFLWFDQAYEQNDGGLSEIRRVPLLENLQNDPRWPALLDKLGLSDSKIADIGPFQGI